MTAHDQVNFSEMPGGNLPGLLVKASTARQLRAALYAIPLAELPSVIRDHLQERGGRVAQDRFGEEFIRGQVFK